MFKRTVMAMILLGTAALCAPPPASAEPSTANTVPLYPKSRTNLQPFPTVYRELFFDDEQVRHQYGALFTISQSKQIVESGLAAVWAGSGLPYNDFAADITSVDGRWMVNHRGCMAIGVSPERRYSPRFKKTFKYTIYFFGDPAEVKYMCKP